MPPSRAPYKTTQAKRKDIAVAMDLMIRKTHKFVGSAQHLDEWQSIGTHEVFGPSIDLSEYLADEKDDEGGIEDARVSAILVAVQSDADKKQIEQALRDTHTSVGCAHEYDCCGCRSYMVTRVSRVSSGGDKQPNFWVVFVASSRNF